MRVWINGRKCKSFLSGIGTKWNVNLRAHSSLTGENLYLFCKGKFSWAVLRPQLAILQSRDFFFWLGRKGDTGKQKDGV